MIVSVFFFFQAEDGIRDLVRSRGLGDVYKRQNLHNLTNDVLPTLMQDHAENQVKTLELVEKESASRVSADDTLSNRINSLDTRVREDIQRVARELETTLSALVATETEERTGRIAAIGRQMERDIQRLDTMENTLPLSLIHI